MLVSSFHWCIHFSSRGSNTIPQHDKLSAMFYCRQGVNFLLNCILWPINKLTAHLWLPLTVEDRSRKIAFLSPIIFSLACTHGSLLGSVWSTCTSESHHSKVKLFMCPLGCFFCTELHRLLSLSFFSAVSEHLNAFISILQTVEQGFQDLSGLPFCFQNCFIEWGCFWLPQRALLSFRN